MSQSCFSLWFISQNSFWKFSTFHGYKGIYSRVCKECEKSFFCKTGSFGDSHMTGTSREFQSRNNWLARLSFLSCSAPAVMTLQLPACFTRVLDSSESLLQVNREFQSREAFLCTHLINSSYFHLQPLHYSYLDIGFLNTELQINLTQNKTNT